MHDQSAITIVGLVAMKAVIWTSWILTGISVAIGFAIGTYFQVSALRLLAAAIVLGQLLVNLATFKFSDRRQDGAAHGLIAAAFWGGSINFALLALIEPKPIGFALLVILGLGGWYFVSEAREIFNRKGWLNDSKKMTLSLPIVVQACFAIAFVTGVCFTISAR